MDLRRYITARASVRIRTIALTASASFRKAHRTTKRRKETHWCLEKLGSIRSVLVLHNTYCSDEPATYRPGSIGNLVLQDTYERVYAGKLYADDRRGIHLIRGENILLMGEIVRSCHILPRYIISHFSHAALVWEEASTSTNTRRIGSRPR